MTLARHPSTGLYLDSKRTRLPPPTQSSSLCQYGDPFRYRVCDPSYQAAATSSAALTGLALVGDKSAINNRRQRSRIPRSSCTLQAVHVLSSAGAGHARVGLASIISLPADFRLIYVHARPRVPPPIPRRLLLLLFLLSPPTIP